MSLPQLPQDKANHLAYGAAIAAVLALLTPLWLAAFLCVAIAVAKEIYDHCSGTGTPEPWDAFANIAGSALVLAPIYLRPLLP